MAQRICRVCGDPVTRPRRGRLPERCDPCRRKRDFLPGSKTYDLTCTCCGAAFVGGHPHAMYCSRSCNKKAQRKTDTEHRPCAVCGSMFASTRNDRRFCSRRCIGRANRERTKPQPYDMKLCKCGAIRSHGARCPRCDRLRRAKAKAAKSMSLPTNEAPWVAGPCIVCGRTFTFNQSNAVTCSARCGRRRLGHNQTDRQRALKYGSFYEVVSRSKVFKRDGYRCGICGGQTDPDVKVPHHNAATLDHIIPVSLGGAHAYRNVQCAHFDCNWDKSDSLPTLADLLAA